jgi:hypothetical protein
MGEHMSHPEHFLDKATASTAKVKGRKLRALGEILRALENEL